MINIYPVLPLVISCEVNEGKVNVPAVPGEAKVETKVAVDVLNVLLVEYHALILVISAVAYDPVVTILRPVNVALAVVTPIAKLYIGSAELP